MSCHTASSYNLKKVRTASGICNFKVTGKQYSRAGSGTFVINAFVILVL